MTIHYAANRVPDRPECEFIRIVPNLQAEGVAPAESIVLSLRILHDLPKEPPINTPELNI